MDLKNIGNKTMPPPFKPKYVDENGNDGFATYAEGISEDLKDTVVDSHNANIVF